MNKGATGLIRLNEFHLKGKHDQSSHAHGGGGSGSTGDSSSSTVSRATDKGFLGKGTGPPEVLTDRGFKTFRDRYTAAEWGNKHYKTYVQEIEKDPKMAEAMNNYIFHGTISNEIRTGKLTSGTKELVDSVDKYLANAPKIPEDVMIYRGSYFSKGSDNPIAQMLENNPKGLVGKTIKDPAFQSTSLERRVAKKYTVTRGNFDESTESKQKTTVVFEIEAKKGSTGTYVSSPSTKGVPGIRNLGKWLTQTEVLLPRDSGLKIRKVGEPDKDGIITIQATLVQ